MSNKGKGSRFEHAFARILSANGFWARLDKGYSQTCDIIAGKNNIVFLFECKTVARDYFDINRVEFNQQCSRVRFRRCGNHNAWFVYKLDDGRIFLSKDAITKPSEGVLFDDWIRQV